MWRNGLNSTLCIYLLCIINILLYLNLTLYVVSCGVMFVVYLFDGGYVYDLTHSCQYHRDIELTVLLAYFYNHVKYITCVLVKYDYATVPSLSKWLPFHLEASYGFIILSISKHSRHEGILSTSLIDIWCRWCMSSRSYSLDFFIDYVYLKLRITTDDFGVLISKQPRHNPSGRYLPRAIVRIERLVSPLTSGGKLL